MNTKTIEVDGKKLHLVLGQSVSQWENQFDADENLWDFPIEELIDGTIEINEDIYYFLINGRCYETSIEVQPL